MWGAIGGLLSAVGSVASGFFGFKGRQADVVQSAIGIIGEANSSNAQREQAIATIIASEATSGYWLAAVWRPMLMMVFAAMLVSWWFGYVPPNFNDAMSPMMMEIFSLLKLGIGGYIGGRTLEKIVSQMNIAKVLQKFIEKKLG